MSEIIACALWVLGIVVLLILASLFGRMMEYLTEECDYRRLFCLVRRQFYRDKE